MIVLRAFKTELDLNNKQRTVLFSRIAPQRQPDLGVFWGQEFEEVGNGRAMEGGPRQVEGDVGKQYTDVGMYEFRRQLQYKGGWYGCEVLLADRFYPSTKRCSQCGQIKPVVELNEREYCCEHCGLVTQRDLNASRNLEQLLYLG